MIAGIYRTTIIVLVPQGAATIKALIRFGIVKHAEQLLHARSQQIISAAIHDRKFVPAHKLFTTMSSDEFKMGKKIPLLVMRRGIKCDIQKLDSQLLNNIA